jgi:hypothetical protein
MNQNKFEFCVFWSHQSKAEFHNSQLASVRPTVADSGQGKRDVARVFSTKLEISLISHDDLSATERTRTSPTVVNTRYALIPCKSGRIVHGRKIERTGSPRVGGGVGEGGHRIGGHFVRAEPRERPVDSIRGLLSGTERKNGWQLAEYSHAVGRCRRISHDFPPRRLPYPARNKS